MNCFRIKILGESGIHLVTSESMTKAIAKFCETQKIIKESQIFEVTDIGEII